MGACNGEYPLTLINKTVTVGRASRLAATPQISCTAYVTSALKIELHHILSDDLATNITLLISLLWILYDTIRYDTIRYNSLQLLSVALHHILSDYYVLF